MGGIPCFLRIKRSWSSSFCPFSKFAYRYYTVFCITPRFCSRNFGTVHLCNHHTVLPVFSLHKVMKKITVLVNIRFSVCSTTPYCTAFFHILYLIISYHHTVQYTVYSIQYFLAIHTVDQIIKEIRFAPFGRLYPANSLVFYR